MKKIYIGLLVGVLIMSLVGAVVVNELSKTRELEKAQRDELLSQTNAGEISPVVAIKCSDNYCLWSAVQSGIINSFDNRIDKSYCDSYDKNNESETYEECLSYTDYTTEELENIVADAVQNRLGNYADASIQRKTNAFEDKSAGEVTIDEKK